VLALLAAHHIFHISRIKVKVTCHKTELAFQVHGVDFKYFKYWLHNTPNHKFRIKDEQKNKSILSTYFINTNRLKHFS
jgi:hypothetical protein